MSEIEVAQKNRRSSRRRTAKLSTKVTCFKGSLGLGHNLAVKVLDLSETGIRIVLKSALPTGQEIEVSLQGPYHCRPFKVLARVMWCVEAADGTFCVGAHFQKGLCYSGLLDMTSQQ